jgi:hypothetical protein
LETQDKKKYLIEMYAGKVVSNMKRITAIWSKLDYYTEHGIEEPQHDSTLEQQIEDLSIGEILQLYDNLPPLISRWKKKIKELPEGKEKEVLKKNLELKENELARIKKLKDAI